MIICLLLYVFLNYFAYAFDFPVWVCGVFYAVQLICAVIANILWVRLKDEVRELRRQAKGLKCYNDMEKDFKHQKFP